MREEMEQSSALLDELDGRRILGSFKVLSTHSQGSSSKEVQPRASQSLMEVADYRPIPPDLRRKLCDPSSTLRNKDLHGV